MRRKKRTLVEVISPHPVHHFGYGVRLSGQRHWLHVTRSTSAKQAADQYHNQLLEDAKLWAHRRK
jgi:hypothetical protein